MRINFEYKDFKEILIETFSGLLMRSCISLYFTLMFLSGSWDVVHGQSGILSFGVPVFEVELPASYNDYIYCDSYGYLWISSVDGVFRSSGRGLKSYLRKTKDTPSTNSIIHSNFFEDRFGDIFVASYNNINKYVRSKDDFESFKITNTTGDTITENYKIIHLQQDTILWLKAGENIYAYNLNTETILEEIPSEGMFFCVDENKDGSLNRIYACFYITSGLQIIDLNADGSVNTVTWEWSPDSKIMDCLVENDTLVWLFGNDGVISLNPDNLDGAELAKGLRVGDEIQHGVSIDSNAILLVNRLDLKAVLDKKNLEISYAKKAHSDALYSAYLDPNKLLWLKGDNSNTLSAFWIEKDKFKLIFPVDMDTLNARLEFFLEDSQLRRWFVSKTKGVFLYDKNRNLKKYFPYSREVGKLHSIHNLTEDQAGKIWAIGNEHIYTFNEGKMSWDVVVDEPGYNLNSLINLSDSIKLVSSLQGIYKLKQGKDSVKWEKANLPEGVKDDDIMYMFEGENGTVYTSTISHFWVFKYDKEKDRLGFISRKINAIVFDIYEDPISDTVWIGTTAGLLFYDKDKDELENALSEHTLATEIQVLAISRDHNDNLWLATHVELIKYDMDADLLTRYDLGQEVPVGSINLASGRTTNDKSVCFVSSNGLLEFDPLSVKPYQELPNVEIIDLKNNNVRYRFGEGKNIDGKEVFKYYENSFSFSLNAVGHYLPQGNSVYYRLKGFDDKFTDDFIRIEDRLSISYNNLSPGEYVLETYTINSAGIDSKKNDGRVVVKELLRFEIEKPIWQKWWFFMIVFFSFVGIFFALFKMRLAQEYRKQQLVFASKSEERNRIAGELHDEIGSGLSSIRLLSDTSIFEETDHGKISRLTFELQEKMSDIIWAMNVDEDTLESLIGVLYEHAEGYLSPNNLNLDIQISRKFPEYELGGEKRRDILLIVKEVLHNVVKHAKAENVLLKIEIKNDVFLLLIADDGIGFDPDIKKSRSNGLRNIRKRVEGMNGKLSIDGSEGGKFTIEVPLKVQAKIRTSIFKRLGL